MMPIVDLFSKRQRRARGESLEVYVYDNLPNTLRVQIVQILQDGLPVPAGHEPGPHYQLLHDTIARELGVFRLNDDHRPHHKSPHKANDFINHFLNAKDAELALDCVEMGFRLMTVVHENAYELLQLQPRVRAGDAINELNARFKEHAVGYEFDGKSIVRIDSQLLHASAVKPTLSLLRGEHYAAAQEEFLRAHEHYRHQRFEEAITDALKALESVLKVICTRRRWQFKANDTAKSLLDIVFSNGLIPAYLQSEFSALRTTLESGVPTIRNKAGAHGAGIAPRRLEPYLVSYVLHLAASSILLLHEAETAIAR